MCQHLVVSSCRVWLDQCLSAGSIQTTLTGSFLNLSYPWPGTLEMANNTTASQLFSGALLLLYADSANSIRHLQQEIQVIALLASFYMLKAGMEVPGQDIVRTILRR